MDFPRLLKGAALALPLLVAMPQVSAYAAGQGQLIAAGGAKATGFGKAFSVMLPAAAKYLGVAQASLQQDMRGGESLAQIASAEGKPLSGLESAIEGAVKQAIERQVKAKKLTSAQAATQEKSIAAEVARLVQGQGLPGGGGFAGRRGGSFAVLMPAAAKYLGLSETTLQHDMASGKSLAQVASGEKKPLAGLESALVTALKQAVGQELAAKKLSSTQAKAQESQAAAAVKRFVQQKGFGHPPGGGSPPG